MGGTGHSCVLHAIFAMGCVTASPPDEDISADQSALQIVGITASGAETGNGASNAIDGMLSTRWSNLGIGSWIQADLGSEKSVSRVWIAWYVGDQRINRFQI